MSLKQRNLTHEEFKKLKELMFWEKIDIVSMNYWNTKQFKYPSWLKTKYKISDQFKENPFEDRLN